MARSINLIVIHCSATQNGKVFGVEAINGWHRQRGFRRAPAFMARQNPSLDAIGYHFVVYTNGAVATGRHLEEVGAHVQGFNQKSIGVCVVGGLQEGKTHAQFTAAQWDSLRGLIVGLQKQYPDARIVGHRDLSPDKDGDGKIERAEWLKDCPGFAVQGWLDGGMKPLPGHELEGA